MIKKILALSMVAMALGVSSCGDPEDLVTANAKEGGLVVPVDDELSYVTGGELSIAVMTTPGTKEIKFYKSFSMDGEVSDEVLDNTVSVSDGEASYTADYAALKEGIAGLPDSDAGLVVGDFWTFRLVSVLEDGREVQSGSIKAVVDNPYSGDYTTVGHLDRDGGASADYVDEKALTTIDGNTCQTLGAYGFFNNPTIFFNLTVEADNTVTIEPADGAAVVIGPQPGKTSTYDPVKKEFVLYYQYVNATGLRRIITETITRVE